MYTQVFTSDCMLAVMFPKPCIYNVYDVHVCAFMCMHQPSKYDYHACAYDAADHVAGQVDDSYDDVDHVAGHAGDDDICINPKQDSTGQFQLCTTSAPLCKLISLVNL